MTQKIPQYKEKFIYLACRRQGLGMYCEIALSKKMGLYRADAIHHTKIHNTTHSRINYPDVVHSLLNLTLVKNDPFHMSNPFYGQKKNDNWAKKTQDFLNKPIHSKCKNFINNLKW